MPKRLTYEHVKNYIQKHGEILLDNEYKNHYTKLKIKCKKGHVYETRFNSFQQGHGCAECFGNKKLSYQYVKDYIEEQGDTLLSSTYKNAMEKLKIKCQKGHVYEMAFSDFKSKGNRCFECFGNKKLSYQYVKGYIEGQGEILLSKSYRNSYTKLKIKCQKGHVYEMAFSDFKSKGHRCSECYYDRKRLSHEYVSNYIKEQGETLLSKYKDSKLNLKVKCEKGHIYNVTFSNFKQGCRCKKCDTISKSHDYQYIKNYIQEHGSCLISKSYKNAYSKLKIKCQKGHFHNISFDSFQQGHRCPQCAYDKKRYNYESVKERIEKEGMKLVSTTYEHEDVLLDVIDKNGNKIRVTFNDIRRSRESLKNRRWKRSIKERDNYTCMCCLQSFKRISKSLHVHHIYNYKDYPDKRLDPLNGITFCSTCHYKFHAVEGKKNNNPQQVIQFLKNQSIKNGWDISNGISLCKQTISHFSERT